MLEPDARRAVERLTEAMLSVKPLLGELPGPIRIVPVGRAAASPDEGSPAGQGRALRDLLHRITRQVGVSGLALAHTDTVGDLQVFERVISARLALGDWARSTEALRSELLDAVDEIVAETVERDFDAFAQRETIASFDGVPLNVYAAGQGDEVVVLVPACGMPARLAEKWIRYFARSRRVLTWESRGLFRAADHCGDYATEVAAQATDLFSAMDHYGVESAHVIGLCGGATIALAAAAERPTAVTSLSLWHGAYGFKDGYPKTRHQHGLIELMSAAARNRAAARAVHAAFCQAMLTGTPAEVAHLVLYPYANAELLYRYCRLNIGITSTDVETYLANVRQPTLVVTSDDDDIAHPDGSIRVARGLRNGHLRVEAHGNHISLFNARNTLLRTAEDFMETHQATAP
jgi:3-oxoadipate enol-lactonase